MTPTTNNRISPFQWSPGGWFGTSIGSTLWLLIGSVVLFRLAPLAGFVWLAAFTLANCLGLALWAKRQRLPAYSAFQFFLCSLAVLSLVSMATADWSGHLPALVSGSQHPRLIAYGAILVFPLLMLLFYFRERATSPVPDRSA